MHSLVAQFCVCMFLDSIDRTLNIFQNLSGFQTKNIRGFRVQIPVMEILSALSLCRGFGNKPL